MINLLVTGRPEPLSLLRCKVNPFATSSFSSPAGRPPVVRLISESILDFPKETRTLARGARARDGIFALRVSFTCAGEGPSTPRHEKKERKTGAQWVGGECRRWWACLGLTSCVRGGGRGGRWTSAIEIFSRSLGRGSWPRRAWLAPSVGPRRPGKPPLGPSNPRGRQRTTVNEKEREKKKEEREKRNRGNGKKRAGPMRTN